MTRDELVHNARISIERALRDVDQLLERVDSPSVQHNLRQARENLHDARINLDVAHDRERDARQGVQLRKPA